MVEQDPSRRIGAEQAGLYRRRLVPNPKDIDERLELFSQSVANGAKSPSWQKRLRGDDEYMGILFENSMFYWLKSPTDFSHADLRGIVQEPLVLNGRHRDYASLHTVPSFTDSPGEIAIISWEHGFERSIRDAVGYFQRSLGPLTPQTRFWTSFLDDHRQSCEFQGPLSRFNL